jgi:glycosyltransferase involved in cell wall biosynthesis
MKRQYWSELAEEHGRLRVVYAVTVPVAISYFGGQLRYMRECGYEVTVISSPGDELDRAAELEGVQIIPLPIAREISPVRDLISFWRLWRVMRRLRPAITNVGTPKAGLLGGLASLLAGVPCRIYTLHGFRLETTEGLKRRMLAMAERLACLCAHRVVCVSESLRQKAESLGIGRCERMRVLGSGSCNGIDVAAYSLEASGRQRVRELRRNLGIPEDAPVIGFVGRLTRSKGVAELFWAYCQVRRAIPNVRLLLAGRFEEGEPLSAEVRQAIERDAQIVLTGFVTDTTPYYHLMDVLALASYREGFPNVVLEAHAAGKPVVAFRATGTVDAVIDGKTGILLPIGDVQGLAEALELLLKDKSLNAAMGKAGRERARREFPQERIWEALEQEYAAMLERCGLPLPKTHERRPQPPPSGGEPALIQL